jgi:hypothetical protein
MAQATSLTIGTSRKVSANYQSHEVSVAVSYDVERGDPDLLQLAAQKASEVEQVYQAVSSQLRGEQQEETRRQPLSLVRDDGDDQDPSSTPGEVSESSPVESPPTEPLPGELDYFAEDGNGSVTAEELATKAQVRAVYALATRLNMSRVELQELLRVRFGTAEAEQLRKSQATAMLLELQRKDRQRVKESKVA